MGQPEPPIEADPPIGHAGLSGRRLVHYGPFGGASPEDEAEEACQPVAVFVCHGMGQQVRYETISSVAQALRSEAATRGGTVRDVEVHLAKEGDGFLARTQIAWEDSDAHEHCVHIYEAYWAPLTEGRVTYRDTVRFLFSAAWMGIRYSVPFGPRSFLRWIFGRPREMRIGRVTFFGLICVVIFLLVQVGIIGFVLLELAQQYKTVLVPPLPAVDLHLLSHGLRQLLYDWLQWLGPFFPEHAALLHAPAFGRNWWWSFAKLGLWFALIAEALFVRYFLIEYVGDVAAYISPYKDSKFDELRHEIQKVALDVGKIIYGFGPPNLGMPHYDKILVVGHSLGSVLAYDTLNALINLDNVSSPADRRGVVGRTRALITFGSPLDKTAFIFRMQPKNEQDWIREQLVASVQPLIVDYALYRPPSFEWVNIWSRMDIISGELNYYDMPTQPPNAVQNMIDQRANIPFAAHIQYWENPLLRQQLYRFVSSSL
jgi:hypothetical protein